MFRSFRRIAVVTIGLLVALVPSAARGEVTPVGLITGPEDQWQAFANDTWLAWTTNSVSHPNRWNVLVRPIAGGDERRANAKGTFGFAGNFEPGTNRLIYEQESSSDVGIFFYDADTHHRSKVPGVNTPKVEWQPKISNAFILFLRNHKVNGKWFTDVLLYVRATQHTRVLGTWPNSKVIRTGNVGEQYATFFVGSNKGYFPYLYDSVAKTRTRIQSPQPWTWAPLVDETNGTVYFAASGNQCGSHANIWRLPISLSGTPTKIVDLPDGVDIGWVMSLAPDSILGQDLLFYRLNCSKRQGDVYMAPQVDQVT